MTGLKDITLLVAYDTVRDKRFSSFTSDERRIRYHRQYFYFWNKLITKLKTQEKELEELVSETTRLKNKIFKVGWEDMGR